MRAAPGAAVLLLAAWPAVPMAQAPTVRGLAAPTASWAEPFSSVRGVRELADGRVVVLDQRELRIVVLDFARGTATAVGRTGRGPGEYTMPLRLLAFPGDTTAAFDMNGNRAFVVAGARVAPQGIGGKGIAPGAPPFQRLNDQVDARGRLYREISLVGGPSGAPVLQDSAGIERLDRATGRVDTVARKYARAVSPLLDAPLPRPAPGAPTRPARGGVPPFISIDQWAVAPDGRVAVVSVAPYRVRIHGPDGRVLTGPPLPFAPIAVTDAHKAAHRAEREGALVPSLSFGADRTMTAGFTRAPYREPGAWPEVLPPFLSDALHAVPDGTFWVQRTTAAGAQPTFDVIGRDARVSHQVVLPRGTRLAGFGARSVYVVRVDEDGLETLQRHPMP